MKYIIFIITLLIIVLSFTMINKTINFKDTEWLKNSPQIIKNAPTDTRFSFTVTEPATIYWRIYTTNIIVLKAHDLTNTNNLHQTIAYGGNFSKGNGAIYTNTITNLTPVTDYILYTIAVSYIGNFPKDIKKQAFKTSL